MVANLIEGSITKKGLFRAAKEINPVKSLSNN